MHILIWFIVFVYGLMLLFVLLYSSTQFALALSYLNFKRKEETPTLKSLPKVTIQLPIYNESYVTERLIDSVCQLNYPKELLEIQVLDDSTDSTIEIVDAAVAKYQAQGFHIEAVRREKREGFKAGALSYGLTVSEGEFVAIFDADFLPQPGFLKATLPYFQNEKVGMVQTRWEHLNKDYSLLTELQAFGLDAHFSIEQSGRNQAGHFINFNGTAGIWRKSTIADAGGWQSDTLTEDLDLSYRAQLKGWQFKYLEGFGSPAELPAVMNALKTQQYRWTKGGAECAVKNLPKVIQSKDLSWKTKLHASFHLLNTFVFICIMLTGILSFPMLLIKNMYPQYDFIFEVAALFSVSFFFLAFFYWASRRHSVENDRNSFWKSFWVKFPLFLSVYMGLSLHNSIAVIEGYLGRKTPFVRTPKFNLIERKDSWFGNQYLRKQVNPLTYFEIALALYFGTSIVVGFQLQEYGLLPFHIMLTGGFLFVSVFSFLHSARS